jgi:nucleoside-diphosphate-sugar epimerase
MSKVLIIGATGYIGRTVAQSLLRSGNYAVYGIARSLEKAKQLAALEIIPVNVTSSDSNEHIELIRDSHIDIVVMCGGDREAAKIFADLKNAGKDRLETAQKAGLTSPKLGVVYTSGVWVHGSSHKPVNDLDVVGHASAHTQPPKLVAWRPTLEQEVIASSDVLNVAVIRPALVYGGSGDIWSLFFSPILHATRSNAESVSIPANDDAKLGLVHVDDVASGITALVDRLEVISGTGVYPVFDLQTSRENLSSIINSAAKHIGFKGKLELAGAGDNAFAIAMNTSLNINSGRARTLLGWQPKRSGMESRMAIYAMSWLAAQD